MYKLRKFFKEHGCSIIFKKREVIGINTDEIGIVIGEINKKDIIIVTPYKVILEDNTCVSIDKLSKKHLEIIFNMFKD